MLDQIKEIVVSRVDLGYGTVGVQIVVTGRECGMSYLTSALRFQRWVIRGDFWANLGRLAAAMLTEATEDLNRRPQPCTLSPKVANFPR